MARDFTLRYRAIDGIGDFSSRDGDGAAAMRYAEARLTPIAELLLSKSIRGRWISCRTTTLARLTSRCTCPPACLWVLLNGASGIAVGMATEIPSLALNEVTQAGGCAVEKADAGNRPT